MAAAQEVTASSSQQLNCALAPTQVVHKNRQTMPEEALDILFLGNLHIQQL